MKRQRAEIEAHDCMEYKFQTQEYEMEQVREDADEQRGRANALEKENKKLREDLKRASAREEIAQDRIRKLRKEREHWKTQYEEALDGGAELQKVEENGPLISNDKDWDGTMTIVDESHIGSS